MRRLIILSLLITFLISWWFYSSGPKETSNPFQIGKILGGTAAEGYSQALEPRQFLFPQDHGPHPEFRNEWWYFTGNLEDASAHRFGFQLVFFRNALSPDPVAVDSGWRSNQAWMAHLALTDVAGQQFHAFEQFSRGAKGLAGARDSPFQVWLHNWSVTESDGNWRLQARKGKIEIELTLTPQRKPLLQGRDGFSQKGAQPGNASYYYSIPRLKAEGRIKLMGKHHKVKGLSWLDREWSTSALEQSQSGWDWFSLQLSNGSDLMFYRLRRKDGSSDPHSAGTLLQHDGEIIRLDAAAVQLKELEWWDSPTGSRYPISWKLEIPEQKINLTITPVLKSQELDLLIRYWEGAVDVSGSRASQPLNGRGYLELTGYAEKTKSKGNHR